MAQPRRLKPDELLSKKTGEMEVDVAKAQPRKIRGKAFAPDYTKDDIVQEHEGDDIDPSTTSDLSASDGHATEAGVFHFVLEGTVGRMVRR